MRTSLHTFIPLLPPPHSHAHIPERASEIHPSVVRLANIMGRPAEDVESEIHSVIARQFAKGNFLSLELAVKCHGEAQAFYDAFKLERDWPEENNEAT